MSDRRTVSGMLVPFGRWQRIDSEGPPFLEQFLGGSLRRSLAERLKSKVRGYFEHRRSQSFGAAAIMDIRRAWEEPGGAFYEAELLAGLPEHFVDGLRRGLYGTSLGARVVKANRDPRPGRSAWNPDGIEERTYREVDLFDISITAQPTYPETTVALRSAPRHAEGAIYRVSPAPLVIAPAWALEAPQPRDYLHEDYLADPHPDPVYL